MTETKETGRALEAAAVERRLEQLRAELRQGEARLRELDAERVRVHETLLRIEGAIVVLEELGGNEANGRPPAPPGEAGRQSE